MPQDPDMKYKCYVNFFSCMDVCYACLWTCCPVAIRAVCADCMNECNRRQIKMLLGGRIG